MNESEIRDMYSHYSSALNARRLEELDDLIGARVVLNGLPVPRAAVISAISHNLDAVPDMRWELDEMLIDGDRVAVRATNTGTPVKKWLGVEPSGARFEIAEIAIYKIDKGRFVEMTFAQDSTNLLRQLHTVQ